jgi:CheY-like chemotaxis protein
MNGDKGHDGRSSECETGDEFSFGSNAPLRLSVLLIDDMETLLFTLGSGLRQYGHTVCTARSGREGIELFKANQIDAIICDLGLDDMDGWQVGKSISEICRESDRSKPPFILMTGWGLDISEQTKIPSSGVDMVLEKPVEIPELIEALQHATRS